MLPFDVKLGTTGLELFTDVIPKAHRQLVPRHPDKEELVIAVAPAPDGKGTRVTGSSYLFDMQVSRFFTTIAPIGEV